MTRFDNALEYYWKWTKDLFVVGIDVHGTHHIVRFYQNDSLEIMRRIKNELPVEEE